MSSLPLPIAAFFAGLISFLSPCVLPLVPGYVSMISGAGLDELRAPQSQLKRRVMFNSVAFILGFSVVFIALGAAATVIGQALGQYRSLLAREAGVVIILFGLHMTGLVTIKALYTDVRLHSVKGSSTVWGSFAIGFAFAFGWTPCVGPILSVILGFASAQASAIKGIFLLATYSLGLAVPFLLTSLGIEKFLGFYNRFRRHMHVVEVASGVVLVALGELLVFDRFTLISNWLSFLNRFEFWLEGVVIHGNPVAVVIAAIVIALALYLVYRQTRVSGTFRSEGVVVKRSPLVIVVVAFVVALMLYFGFHQARRSGVARAQLAGVAAVAPDFSLESIDGRTVRLSDLRGKAVLLNFWATWCGPCKIEMPWFVDLQKEYGSQGLQIVGVAMDDASKEDIAKFAKDMGVNYPILIGKDSVGDQYGGVPALPESFLISRDGKIVDKIVGLIGKGEIEEAVKKTLDTGPTTAQASSSMNSEPSEPQR
jgi:cytochrome c-type biogenesis protein